MTPDEIIKARDKFLNDITEKTHWPKEKIVEFLRARGLTYNKRSEEEIRTIIAGYIEGEKRRSLIERLKTAQNSVKLPDSKCWLANVPEVECKGIKLLDRSERTFSMPRCSIGGVRHYLTYRRMSANPSLNVAEFLQILDDLKKDNEAREEMIVEQYWKRMNE